MKKRSGSSRCSAGSADSGSGLKIINPKLLNFKGSDKVSVAITATSYKEPPLVIEDFYKARKPRKTKISPALRSDWTGLKVYDIYNQRMRKDEISGTLRPNFTKGSRSGFALIAPALRSDRIGLKVVSGLMHGRGFETRKDELSHAIKGALGGGSKNFVASGRTTTTNTPAKSTGQDSETRSLSRGTSGISERRTYPTMTSSQLAFLVRVFPLRENVEVFKTSQGELFSSKSAESYEIKDQATYSLRMLRDYFLTTKAEPSQSYSFRWMSLGMMRNGLSQTLSITYRKIGKGSLSSVLEEKVDDKYYISKTMLRKIIEKKDAHPEIRWKSGIKGEGRVPFPDDPGKPSRAITQAESGANRMTHGILVSRREGIIKKINIANVICRPDYRGLNRNSEQNAVLIHNVYGGFGEKKPRIFNKHSPTLRTPKGGGHLPGVLKDARIRRLIPIECERLQGFPDNWTKEMSDTQRYKQMGNAVSVPVIEAIGRKILEAIQ